MPSALALSRKSRRSCSILFLASDIWAPWCLQHIGELSGCSTDPKDQVVPGSPYVDKIDAIDHKCQQPSDDFQPATLKITLAHGLGQLANRRNRGDRAAAQHELSSKVQRTALAARTAVEIPDR